MKLVNRFKFARSTGHLILWGTVCFIIVLLLWMYFASVDQIVEATGRVVPSRKAQLVQNLEGGIIKSIEVEEGRVVKKGQVLLYLSDVRFSSEFEANQKKVLELEIKIQRLRAEAAHKPFELSDTLKKKAPKLWETEYQLFKTRQHELEALSERQKLLEQEVNMTRPLVQRGSASRVELLRLRQSLTQLKQQIYAFHSATIKELKEAMGELSKFKEADRTLKDRLQRTAVKSPVKGIVKQIYVTTEGGVIQPGMNVMEIVPLGDKLRIEAQVRPEDIAFVHLGQQAVIRVSAYDYSIYGALKGKVEHVSADSSLDKENNSYYEVWVSASKNYLEHKGQKLSIIPGMLASVGIIAGKKTILNYLLKPLLRAKEKALTQP